MTDLLFIRVIIITVLFVRQIQNLFNVMDAVLASHLE